MARKELSPYAPAAKNRIHRRSSILRNGVRFLAGSEVQRNLRCGMSVSESPMPFGITKIMSALLRRKCLLCRALIPVRVLMYGPRTGIHSGSVRGKQSFRTGSRSSAGCRLSPSGWIGRKNFPPTFIWFWKADPVAKTKEARSPAHMNQNAGLLFPLYSRLSA